jgi:DNA-binding NarL/FixJ family response regulator
VVGAAANGEEALRVVSETTPEAILLDLHMPVLDGIEATRVLTERNPEVAIVVLTTYDDDQSVLAALRAGARGYLTKDARRADIAQALRGAVGGLAVLDPGVQATVLAATSERPPRWELPDGLTQREAEILAMIARGKTNTEIAAELFLSSHTVKSHISRIFAKNSSADRAAAIRYAHRHGLQLTSSTCNSPQTCWNRIGRESTPDCATTSWPG